MKKLTFMIMGLALLALGKAAGAVTLSLSPSSQTAYPGDLVSLDLVIDGLGDFSSDSLGAFDLDILFDTNVLTFDSYTLGVDLGASHIDTSLGEMVPGTIDLAAVSLLLPAELDALQSTSFTLATLDFTVDTLIAGTSTTIAIDTLDASLYLSDAFGIDLTLDGVTDAVISNPSVGVPEPSTFALLSLGLLGLGAMRKYRVS